MPSADSIHVPGVHIDPTTGKKSFIPLENNPQTFTTLAHTLGLSPTLTFHDLYSLDLIPLLPRPVHALIFISPAKIWRRVRENDPGTKELCYDGSGPDEPVIWFEQTIGNACGLYALIHSIGNGSAREYLLPGSLMERLLTEAEPLKPVPRAKVLVESRELEEAHMAAAVTGDTAAPGATDKVGHHFISFAKGKDGHLWEMEGGWGQPIDLGLLGEEEDLVSSEALRLSVKRYLDVAEGSVDFSIVALATKSAEE